MKNLFLSIIFSLFYHLLTAQESVKDFAHNNLVLSFGPTFYQAKSVTPDTLGVTFPLGVGYNALIGYNYRVSKKWSIETALGFGKYTLASSAFLTKKQYDYLERDLNARRINLQEFYFTSNLGVNYAHPINQKFSFVTQFKATATYFSSINSPNNHSVSSADALSGMELYNIRFSPPKGWIYRPQIGIGFEKKIAKGNIFRLNIAYERGSKTIISGNYEVRKSKTETITNRYESKGSVLKLELTYLFSSK